MLIYLLKANLLLAALYALYRLLCRDTFFAWRRATLMGIIAVSLLAPLPALHGWGGEILPQRATQGIAAEAWLPESVIIPQQPVTATHGGNALPQILLIAYAAGALLLTCRILAQLLAIARQARHCHPATIGGIRIRQLPRGEAPFSFFRLIFVCPPAHQPDELNEILAHEQTHARQGHSADVMVAELMCALCWFNPAAWLLKREVRNNLEYLADRHVLARGFDPRTYQYHLLGLTYPKAAANLYNNFNVLPLKKRILMMNKRKSKSIGRMKYLLFIPLATLLAAACTGTDADKSNTANEQPAPPVATQAPAPEKKVLDISEVPPEFPGGTDSLMRYIFDNLKYPVTAQENSIQGRVICQFIVTDEGAVDSVKVVRGVSPELDQEAMRVIKAMPKWKPGVQDGQNVSVRFTMPIVFKLQ